MADTAICLSSRNHGDLTMSEQITTYSKLSFNPTAALAEHIIVEDIAHALSLLCRANGHIKNFFSVAQHSINCALEAKARGWSEKVQLACLLHDASEAYISDITRPVKKQLPQYREFEDRLQNIIWNKYLDQALNDEEIKQISEIDDAMLYYEFVDFMDEEVFEHKPMIKSAPDFEFKGFESAERRFLSLFLQLTKEKNENSFLTVGVDGCKGEWIAAAISGDWFEVSKYKTIDEICAKYQDADAVLIDIPIGLPESRSEALKRPDVELRKRLKEKSSSVFNTPFRQIVYAPDIKKAWELNSELDGRQTPISMTLRKAVKQVDRFLQTHPQWQNRLLESHPEYCFYLLNGKKPLGSKLNEDGLKKRMEILNKFFANGQKVIDTYLGQYEFRKKTDDVIDALCLAVAGRMGLENGFETIPDTPYRDSTGLNMQIVAFSQD